MASEAEGPDCEERDTWFLDQDVNAWTSLAYVVVGGLVIALAIRRRLRLVFVVLGLLAIAEGVGSMLYHGGSGDPGRFLHDVALVAAIGFVAGWHVGRVRRSRRRRRAGRDGRGDRRRLGGLGRGAVVDERDGRRARRRDRRRRGARTSSWDAVRLERATAGARRRRPRRVVGGLAGEPGVRRRVLGPATWPVARAHRAARARMGRPGVLRRRPAACAAAVPPGHGPRDRTDRHRFGAGVPPLGRRRRAREPAPRSTRARRRQPRQRLRRPDRRHLHPAPAAAVPGEGSTVEGGRRPPVPRVRRSAARLPLE